MRELRHKDVAALGQFLCSTIRKYRDINPGFKTNT